MTQLPTLCQRFSYNTASKYYTRFQFLINKTCPTPESSVLIKNGNASTELPLEEYRSFFIDICFILLAIFIAICLVKSKNRRNPRHHMTQAIKVDREKIIIALQIEDLFAKVTTRYNKGYLPIRYKKDSEKNIFQTLLERFGYGHYYKPLYSSVKIRQFLNTLYSNQKIEIFLYTRIKETVANALLKQLSIQEYFPLTKRKFCPFQSLGIQKHPIQIDADTRRVVIMTPNKHDHSLEDERYFLTMNNENSAIILRECLWVIKKLVKCVKNLDNLHQELTELKLRLETSCISE